MKRIRWTVLALTLLQVEPAPAAGQEPPASSELLHNDNHDFAGVGQFRGSLICTGSLIDPSNSGAPGAKAWLLTAGHCISLEPYGVIRNQPLTGRVTFNFFVDTPPDRRITVRTRSTGWATMKGIDLALVELDSTLGDLAAQGIRPVPLASSPPGAGRAVFWTGVSGSPIPSELQFVRLGRCTLGQSVQLLEGSWIWTGDLSNDCPDLYAGASGSPLFDADSRSVIGVIGTTTLLNFEQGPDYDCQVNRPCVIRAGGPAMERDTSYAADVRDIARCFDAANALDLERSGCPLDPGFQLNIASGVNEVRPEIDGKPATWNAALSGTQRYYAYKHFRAGEDSCGSPSGYSAPIPVAGAPVIADPVGREDGHYLLCVIAGDTNSIDSSWQQPAHASMRFKRLDSQPPVVIADYEVDQLDNAYRLVFSEAGPSGLGLSLEKRGSLPATDCADSRDYRAQISIPNTIRPSDYPNRICVKISDKAGNFAAPDVFDFGPPALLPNAIKNAASLHRGAVAPGGVFRLDTFNLTRVTESSVAPAAALAGVRMSILDEAGRTLPVPLTTAGPLFLEGVIPPDVQSGTATVVVQPPEGPALSQPVRIVRTAPGLFFENSLAAPKGFASDHNNNVFPLLTCVERSCYATQLPLSSTPGGLDFVLYGSGFNGRGDGIVVRIGTQILNGIELLPHPSIAGLDELHFHVPQDFSLRLFQPVAAETPDGNSNYLWIYLQ